MDREFDGECEVLVKSDGGNIAHTEYEESGGDKGENLQKKNVGLR